MSDHPASRRDVVAAAVTIAAAGTAGEAHAQAPSNLRFFNPPGMSKPPTYSHVVEVNGPNRTVYLAGQTGVDANGKVAEGFRAQEPPAVLRALTPFHFTANVQFLEFVFLMCSLVASALWISPRFASL